MRKKVTKPDTGFFRDNPMKDAPAKKSDVSLFRKNLIQDDVNKRLVGHGLTLTIDIDRKYKVKDSRLNANSVWVGVDAHYPKGVKTDADPESLVMSYCMNVLKCDSSDEIIWSGVYQKQDGVTVKYTTLQSHSSKTNIWFEAPLGVWECVGFIYIDTAKILQEFEVTELTDSIELEVLERFEREVKEYELGFNYNPYKITVSSENSVFTHSITAFDGSDRDFTVINADGVAINSIGVASHQLINKVIDEIHLNESTVRFNIKVVGDSINNSDALGAYFCSHFKDAFNVTPALGNIDKDETDTEGKTFTLQFSFDSIPNFTEFLKNSSYRFLDAIAEIDDCDKWEINELARWDWYKSDDDESPEKPYKEWGSTAIDDFAEGVVGLMPNISLIHVSRWYARQPKKAP